MKRLLQIPFKVLGVLPEKAKKYAPNVANFIAALKSIAPAAGGGSYRFMKSNGECHGFVQFIIDSDTKLTIHRLWTLQPGKGSGAKMLRSLCNLADQHRVELALKVIPIGRKPYPMSREQLKMWYRRYGFQGLGWKLLRQPGMKWGAIGSAT
jgi:hypothetical protein